MHSYRTGSATDAGPHKEPGTSANNYICRAPQILSTRMSKRPMEPKKSSPQSPGRHNCTRQTRTSSWSPQLLSNPGPASDWLDPRPPAPPRRRCPRLWPRGAAPAGRIRPSVAALCFKPACKQTAIETCQPVFTMDPALRGVWGCL